MEETVSPDSISKFYSDHPYPPPVENLDRARDEWQNENRHRSEYHLFWPNQKYRADFEVLIAGCGTWQAAKYAVCHPRARVVGVDVSQTSLDHTEKLRRKYNLTNLELRQVPIERVSELDRQFDLIVCTGVLHHLADPDAGLAALRSVLKPEGAIYGMVYAPYGRAGVYMLQDYCRKLGIGTSEREINELAKVVESLSPHHPLVNLLRGARETQSAEALADALLNPRDRAYSVPQLFDFIEGNGLTFGRWYRQSPYLPQCGAIATTPHAKRLSELPPRDCYTATELLRGTINCHSFITHRSEPLRIHFDDEQWRSYVPIRLPTTLCVQERLPPGAAGVLLNQSHTFHDLILIINQSEKRMFDAIDGQRSISEITVQLSADQSFNARSFFERLWWYDQVVFDASNAGESS